RRRSTVGCWRVEPRRDSHVRSVAGGDRRPRYAGLTNPESSEVEWFGERQGLRLLARQHRILQLLGDARLDDGFRGNLDCLAGGRIAAHPRLALLYDELDHAGQHEFARALELSLRQRRELVEVLAGLRPLHLELL